MNISKVRGSIEPKNIYNPDEHKLLRCRLDALFQIQVINIQAMS